MTMNKGYAPCDRRWFDEDPEIFLSRIDFKEFQEVAGVDFRDLLSEDEVVVRMAQERIVSQTRIFNEVRNEHAGYGVPLLYYTHNLDLAKPIPHKNFELERMSLALDMGDSLRRRHIALSYAILPAEINELYECVGGPITLKNMGSGVGLDVINAIRVSRGKVRQVWNYEIDEQAIDLGRRITSYLENEGEMNPGVISYKPESMVGNKTKTHLAIMIGVMCGLTDAAAHLLLKKAYADLEQGGRLVVSSSNHHMECSDPLANFLIQKIGSQDDPTRGWGLNFRTKETMIGLLTNAGYTRIRIYDDSNYPGRETIPKEILYGVDTLPSRALGHDASGRPLSLPSKEVLDRQIGYNWIAIASKHLGGIY